MGGIGRNEQCPCGSGKKYKRCCIGNKVASFGRKIAHPLQAFNRSFLLDEIASASLSPKNHGKEIRLELLVMETLSHGCKEGGSACKVDFKKKLDEYYPHHPYEDPPWGVFTDIISFHGGDYLVQPGISNSALESLKLILKSVFQTVETLPKDVTYLLYAEVILVLAISDKCLRDSGLNRYEIGDVDSELIELKVGSSIGCLITDEWAKRFCAAMNFSPTVLDSFTLKDTDDLYEEDFDKSPLIVRPLLKVESGYRILSVSNLIPALLHSLIVKLSSQGLLSKVIEIMNRVSWIMADEHLVRSGYSSIVEEFELTELCHNSQKLYRFDNDKIAYVILGFDDGEDYDLRHPNYSFRKHIGCACCTKAYLKNINELSEKFGSDQILVLRLGVDLGRAIISEVDITAVSRFLSFPFSHFDLLMRSREYDPLALWNFATAKATFYDKISVPPGYDDLDLFALYKEKDESFYLNDDALSDWLVLPFSYSTKLVQEIILKEDIHSVRTEDGKGWTQVLKLPSFENVYFQMDRIGRDFVYVIEGYSNPIYVKPEIDVREKSRNFGEVFIRFLDAISYWMWQLQVLVTPIFNKILKEPVIIQFNLDPIDDFVKEDKGLERIGNIDGIISRSVDSNKLSLIISSQLLPFLFGSNNEGERELVKTILNVFSDYEKLNFDSGLLTERKIESIVEEVAPLGKKRKIFLYPASEDVRLDARGLKPVRKLVSYNKELVLDEIVPRSIKAGLILGNEKVIKEPKEFIHEMVEKVLKSWLDEILIQFNSIDLLQRLIENNESIIQKRAFQIFSSPVTIAAYGNESNYHTELRDEVVDLDKIGLSTRCLIEHIVAVPSCSSEIANQSSLDQAIAIMYEIISWGMTADQIHFGLYSGSVDVLPSNRIGTDKGFFETVINPLRQSKTSEDIVDGSEKFEEAFEVDIDQEGEKASIPTKIEDAFEEEFGVTLTEIIIFSQILIEIGYAIDFNCVQLEEKILKSKILEKLPDWKDDKVASAIDFFSLDKRPSLIELPEGYEFFDIMPWRYNRGLSLNRKPIVRVQNEKGEKLCLYGIRQVLVARKQLIYLFFSGKLRCKKGGSLSKLSGENLNRKGKEFTKRVFDFTKGLCTKDDVIDMEVEINPNRFLKSEFDLGDIDVLLIDKSRKLVVLIECKKTEMAKVVNQMAEEVNKLFGSKSKDGWIQKHQKRDEWIKENLPLLGHKYARDLSDYVVVPIIMTSEELPVKFIKAAELPFSMLSFYEYKEKGLSLF